MKRGLVLSGGGNKAAYEAGAIYYLLTKQIHYDVVCGVSFGALNGSIICMFKQGEELEAAEFLKDFWFSIDDTKIWKNWFPVIGKLIAIWKRSAHSTKPLQRMMRDIIDEDKIRKSGKNFCVGAVNLRTGGYRLFDENYYDISGAVLASSAFPCAFEPIKLEGQYWSDSGLREVTPLQAAVDFGCDEIDVIVTGPEYTGPILDDDLKTIDIAIRSLSILIDQVMVDDIAKAVFYNKLADAGVVTNKHKVPLHIIRPVSILNQKFLSFKAEEIQLFFRHGFEDAQRVIESGVTK